MPDPQAEPTAPTQRQRALSRWDNEGGSIAPAPPYECNAAPVMTNAELVHLHIRVIALENVLIAVLAEGSERQRQVAGEMAALIAPREGTTAHALTIQAAKHITDLIARAEHLPIVPA